MASHLLLLEPFKRPPHPEFEVIHSLLICVNALRKISDGAMLGQAAGGMAEEQQAAAYLGMNSLLNMLQPVCQFTFLCDNEFGRRRWSGCAKIRNVIGDGRV